MIKNQVRFRTSLGSLACILACIATLLGLSGCIEENRPFKLLRSQTTQLATPTLGAGELPGVGTIASVKVSKVYDGDTFEFLHEGLPYNVRLSGIDAPERTQEFADRARQALRTSTDGRLVRIEVLKRDAYKRLVCRVILESEHTKEDLSLKLIEQGLAWHFKRYLKDQSLEDQERYAAAEERARNANLGLWGSAQPVPPWVFREQQRAVKAKG